MTPDRNWHSIAIWSPEEAGPARALAQCLACSGATGSRIVCLGDVAELSAEQRECAKVSFAKICLVVFCSHRENGEIVNIIHRLRSPLQDAFSGGIVLIAESYAQQNSLNKSSLFGVADRKSHIENVPGHFVVARLEGLSAIVEGLRRVGWISKERWDARVEVNGLLAERPRILEALKVQDVHRLRKCWNGLESLLGGGRAKDLLGHDDARAMDDRIRELTSGTYRTCHEYHAALKSAVEIIDVLCGRKDINGS